MGQIWTFSEVLKMYAKYTTVLKDLLENEQTKPLIEKALSTYPLYAKKSKEEYIPSIIPTREELNKKLLNAYKYREIGFETVGRFIDELEIAMNEIMPTYNQLLFSLDQDFNILFNVDYQRTTTSDRNGSNENKITGTDSTSTNTTDSASNTSEVSDSTTTNSNINNNSKSVHSSTPQSQLNISSSDIDSISYADDATWNENKNNDSATSTGTTSSTATTSSTGTNTTQGSSESTSTGKNQENEIVLETTKGNFGVVSSQDLILKYRELILNVEQNIINDERISELFMRVF